MKIFKKFNCPILVVFLIGTSFADQMGDGKNLPSLSDLIKQEKSTVDRFDSYVFDVSWSDGKPSLIMIAQETYDLKNKHLKSDTFVSVSSRSTLELIKSMNFFKSLSANISVKKVQRTLVKGTDNNGAAMDLVKYDSYDSNGVLVSSDWRDLKTGVHIEYLLYSKDGKPLTLRYYYQLELNKEFVLPPQGKLLNFTLEQMVEKIGPFNYQNVDDVIHECEKLLSYYQKNTN
jgi:hypothetical protein